MLYGRKAAVEFDDLIRFTPAPPQPRWVPRAHIDDVLAQLTAGSKTVARLQLMHWTGMRPSQMGRLTRADFHLDDPIPYVAVPRGKGGRLAAVPLVEAGHTAARAFIEADAFGPWSCPSANKAIAAAAPPGEPGAVHGLPDPDPAFVRDVAPARGRGSRRHSGSVWTHRRRDNADLRRAHPREAPCGH